MSPSEIAASTPRPPTEASILAAIRAILGSPPPPFGIGDDAAVLPLLGVDRPASMVVSVDAAIEGVHFAADLLSLEDVGYRATMAAASDLAAMGAEPTAFLAALTAPRDTPITTFERIARGQREAADELGAPFVGGNLARGPGLSITTTVLGVIRPDRQSPASARATRSGAQPGDVVAAIGALGLAFAGFSLLQRLPAGERVSHHDPDTDSCLSAFRRPRARIQAGAAAYGLCSAMMDVSDGLATDAMRLAEASGVRLVLSADAIATSGGQALAGAAGLLSVDPVALALTGGEDYALLLTAPPSAALEALLRTHGGHQLGTVQICGRGGSLEVLDRAGAAIELPRGFEHFV